MITHSKFLDNQPNTNITAINHQLMKGNSTRSWCRKTYRYFYTSETVLDKQAEGTNY